MDDGLKFELDGVVYEFDYNSLTVLEGLELKKLAGLTPKDWLDGLGDSDPESIRFMVWLALRRNGTPADGRYSDFDFDLFAVSRSMMELNEVEEVEPDADPTPAETTSA